MNDAAIPDVSAVTSLSIWWLGAPAAPRPVGIVSLVPPGNRKVSFVYDDEWRRSGFPLSPDMPLVSGTIVPRDGWQAPGALDDAMPDRWGERAIRVLDRPKRVTPLDLLYHAGDRRFGALGVSSDPHAYAPYPRDPLITVASLEEAHELIQRIIERRPMNAREKRLVQSGRSIGGAQPKILVAIGEEEWICKFPNGNNVDLPLVEHANMRLARACGIAVVESRVHPIGPEHVVMTRRFDREPGRRLHALSARTMLMAPGGETYAAIADAIRLHGAPGGIAAQRRELFARMVFNVLVDNTDDHAKNHAFLRQDDGSYTLSPAYDLVPQMSGLGEQALPVAFGASGDAYDAALANAARFGMDREEASEFWRSVADGVARWQEVFRAEGVLGSDIEYLTDFIDAADKLELRTAPDRRAAPATRRGVVR